MNLVVTLLMLAATLIVMQHGLSLVAHISPKRWFGCKWKLIGLALANALVCGGAVGALLSWPPSSALMVIGLALFFISDRRM
ncbi:MAG: hypothetical protein WC742_12650 [Gallionellaceae bacterium]|jgi:hypothetical protein